MHTTLNTKLATWIAVFTLFITSASHQVLAAEEKKPNLGIIALPHALHVVMDNKDAFKVMQAQQDQFNTELIAVFPQKMQPLMQEIKAQEISLRMNVMQNILSREDAAEQLKALSDLKYQLSLHHIDAMGTLGEILTDEQWGLMLEKLAQSGEGCAAMR